MKVPLLSRANTFAEIVDINLHVVEGHCDCSRRAVTSFHGRVVTKDRYFFQMVWLLIDAMKEQKAIRKGSPSLFNLWSLSAEV
jgi:hypothetical protein